MTRARARRSIGWLGLAFVVGCRRDVEPGARRAPAAPETASTASPADAPPPGPAAAPLAPDATPPPRPWVQLYYPGWSMAGHPPGSIALAGVDDVVLFGLVPDGDGGVSAASTGLSDGRAAAATAAARAHGARVLVALGGERTGHRFRAALARDGGARLAETVAAFVERHRLDGVVLDVEPLVDVTAADLRAFLDALRGRLRGDGARRLEAIVAPEDLPTLLPLAPALDRIGLMTYLGVRRADAERALVDALVDAGVPPERVGLGVDARTTAEDATRRVRLAADGHVGGVVLWHAGTLCRAPDGGARCVVRAPGAQP